jgi:hypothetical protein
MLDIRFRLTPLLKDVIQFYGVVVLAILFVYYAPVALNKLFFLGLLAWFWKSDKNYFFFALTFVIMQQPGGLFQGSLASDVHRVPLYNLVSGISFDFFDLFFILSFAKAWLRGQHRRIILKRPLVLLAIYLGFLFLLSMVEGMSFGSMSFYLRNFSTYILFVSFPFLMGDKKDLHRFMYLVFPTVFIILLGQLYFLLTSQLLESLFLGYSRTARAWVYREAGSNVLRPVAGLSGSVLLVFFSYIFSLLLSLWEQVKIRQYYLFTVTTVSFLIIFLSATRSWTVVFVVLMGVYIFKISQNKERILKKIASFMIIFLALYLFVPKVNHAVQNALNRMATLEDLATGDVTAAGTLTRITKRLPRVLKGYKQSPVIGLGFTEKFRFYNDYHVGNFNMLMQVGIVGFFFFLYFWTSFFRLLWRNRKLLSVRNRYRQQLLVVITAFLLMLLLHFTSYQFFGFILHRFILYFFIVFFSIAESMVRESRNEEVAVRKELLNIEDHGLVPGLA